MRYNYIVFNTFGSNKKIGDSVASQMINLGNTGESTWDSSVRATPKRLSISSLNARNRDFYKKLPSNSLSKWL
jgi:hypothetical protein